MDTRTKERHMSVLKMIQRNKAVYRFESLFGGSKKQEGINNV